MPHRGRRASSGPRARYRDRLRWLDPDGRLGARAAAAGRIGLRRALVADVGYELARRHRDRTPTASSTHGTTGGVLHRRPPDSSGRSRRISRRDTTEPITRCA